MNDDGAELRSGFREELSELRDTVLRMATFVEGMLVRAMDALVKQDPELAEEVRRSDRVADTLDLEIEEVAMRLLALQQPLARDLRMIAASLRIAADLERVGDYAKDIAKIARDLVSEVYFKPLEDLPAMARAVQEMLHLAVRCFVDRDLELAHQVGQRDKEVDRLWNSLREELMDYMRRDSSYVTQATAFLLVARYLERIGDHTVNVVERVLYMETGKIEKLG